MKEIVKSYEYSPLTKGRVSIITPYIDNVESEDYRRFRGLHTGLDILSGTAHSITSGVVILLTKDSDITYAAGVQFDKVTVFRYGNLREITVGIGDIVEVGQQIGICDKYFHFEYATTERLDSTWPTYAGPVTYYKHDPELVLSGEIVYDSSTTIEVELPADPNIQTVF